MIKAKCLQCGCIVEIDNIREGEGYFLGYDTDYYGKAGEDRDPHEVIGYYCKRCGSSLRAKAELQGYEKID